MKKELLLKVLTHSITIAIYLIGLIFIYLQSTFSGKYEAVIYTNLFGEHYIEFAIFLIFFPLEVYFLWKDLIRESRNNA